MPRGTDSVTHGPIGYTVSNLDWTVEVPDHVGAVLLATGAGAVQIVGVEPAPELEGEVMRVLHASDVGASFSWRGESYLPGEDGVLTIPAAASGDAFSHGFGPLIEA
jgi:hypothetical protein